jgi:hypothetical protein
VSHAFIKSPFSVLDWNSLDVVDHNHFDLFLAGFQPQSQRSPLVDRFDLLRSLIDPHKFLSLKGTSHPIFIMIPGL